jgi:capsular polysaccharide biosynthesis protein
MDFKHGNDNLLSLVIDNSKLLLFVGIIAAILSVVFSSPIFIAPKYESTAIIYPSNLNEYSDESAIEQMMQWFDSREIKDRVIKENDLLTHYEIEQEEQLASYYVLKEYNENITVSETKYESAEINVLDTDPEKAYQIANSIINHFSGVIKEVHQKRAKEDLKTIQKEFEQVKTKLDSVSNKLKSLRTEYSIINYASQSDHVSKGYLKTFDGANSSSVNIKEILKLKNNLEEKGGEFITLEKRFYHLVDDYNYWEKEYLKSRKRLEREITYTNVVSEPQVPVKKVYPVRWVIVLFSTFGAIAFAFALLLFSVQLKSK